MTEETAWTKISIAAIAAAATIVAALISSGVLFKHVSTQTKSLSEQWIGEWKTDPLFYEFTDASTGTTYEVTSFVAMEILKEVKPDAFSGKLTVNRAFRLKNPSGDKYKDLMHLVFPIAGCEETFSVNLTSTQSDERATYKFSDKHVSAHGDACEQYQFTSPVRENIEQDEGTLEANQDFTSITAVAGRILSKDRVDLKKHTQK